MNHLHLTVNFCEDLSRICTESSRFTELSAYDCSRLLVNICIALPVCPFVAYKQNCCLIVSV